MKRVCAALLFVAASVPLTPRDVVAQAAPDQTPGAATPAPATPPATPAESTPAAPASAADDLTSPRPSTIVERVLVRVNGEIFTQTELTRKQVQYLREENMTALPQDQLQAKLAEITPMLLDDAVNNLLLVQRGREMGVTFTDADFQAAIDNIKKQNNLTDEQFEAALKSEGLTRDELRTSLEQARLVQAVQRQEIGPSMTITQEEQRQYYKAHPDMFMTPETVTLRQLLIAVPSKPGQPGVPVDAATDAAAKAQAEQLRAQALNGADFAQLVREHSSTDAASKASGGLVGPVKVADLNPALKDAILSLEPGGVSEPIRTQGGYQILQLENRTTPELRPFDAVRLDIEQAIRSERLGPETEKMIERLREQAVIEWKDDKYKQMYEDYVARQDQAPNPATPPAQANPS